MSNHNNKIIEIIAEQLCLDVADVTLEKNISNDLGADSLDALEVIIDLENHYNIEIPDEQVEAFDTVQDVVDYITANVKED